MLRIITELIYKYKVDIFLIQYSHEHTQYHLLSLSPLYHWPKVIWAHASIRITTYNGATGGATLLRLHHPPSRCSHHNNHLLLLFGCNHYFHFKRFTAAYSHIADCIANWDGLIWCGMQRNEMDKQKAQLCCLQFASQLL